VPPQTTASSQIQAVDRTTLSIGESVMASTGDTHGFPAGGGCWAGSSSQRADKDVACGDSLDKRRSSPPRSRRVPCFCQLGSEGEVPSSRSLKQVSSRIWRIPNRGPYIFSLMVQTRGEKELTRPIRHRNHGPLPLGVRREQRSRARS